MSNYEDGVLLMQQDNHAEWLERARRAAKTHSLMYGEVCADDLWKICPPPEGTDPRTLGAVFHPRKNWEQVGTRRSERSKTNHGRSIAVWRYSPAA
jgi:hypothetical protein